MNTVTQAEAQAIASAFTSGNPMRPSWEAMEATLRQWHEDSLTEPEFMWLAVSFEDMADHVARAIKSAKQPHYLDGVEA